MNVGVPVNGFVVLPAATETKGRYVPLTLNVDGANIPNGLITTIADPSAKVVTGTSILLPI